MIPDVQHLSLASFAGRTGRGVTVAIVDSGVDGRHPQVGRLAGGVAIDASGGIGGDVTDRLGHGTAVAATIREKAPDVGVLSVKVFDDTLHATGAALVAAIRWAAGAGASIINLSLGTTNRAHIDALTEALAVADRAGAVVVAPAPDGESDWLPGGLPGVIGVEADADRPRDTYDLCQWPDGRVRLRASPRPRQAPGVDSARQFKGPSFAVANATGLIAVALEDASSPRTWGALVALLGGRS